MEKGILLTSPVSLIKDDSGMFSYKMIMPRTEVKKDTAAPARIIRREKWSNNVLLLRFRLFDMIYAVADRAITHHRAIIQGEW